MKTLFLRFSVCRQLAFALLLGVALLFSCPAAFAQTSPTCKWVGVEQVSDFTYRVWACNPAAQKGSIKLLDAGGRTLYEQFSSNVNFGNRFNVAELPDGEYQIRVRMGQQLHRYSLSLQSSSKRWTQVKDQPEPTQIRMASVSTPGSIAVLK